MNDPFLICIISIKAKNYHFYYKLQFTYYQLIYQTKKSQNIKYKNH